MKSLDKLDKAKEKERKEKEEKEESERVKYKRSLAPLAMSPPKFDFALMEDPSF